MNHIATALVLALALAGCGEQRTTAELVQTSQAIVAPSESPTVESPTPAPASWKDKYEHDYWTPIEFEPLEQWREELEATRRGRVEECDTEEVYDSGEDPCEYTIPAMIQPGQKITEDNVIDLLMTRYYGCSIESLSRTDATRRRTLYFYVDTCTHVEQRDGVWGIRNRAHVGSVE